MTATSGGILLINENWSNRTIEALHHYACDLSDDEQLRVAQFVTQLEGAEVAALVAQSLGLTATTEKGV